MRDVGPVDYYKMRTNITLNKLSIYSSTGLLWRLSLDLLISNIGMLMGLILTLAIWIHKAPITPGQFLVSLITRFWVADIPILTLSCMLGYILSGLYRIGSTENFGKILLIVSRSILTALLIHTLLLYFSRLVIPHSMFVSGWFYIAVLIFSHRFIRAYFQKTYKLVPLATYTERLDHNARDLILLAQQDGWAPPEALPAESPWPYFADDEVLSAATVLQSGRVNQWTGREIQLFQEEFAAHCGVKHAIALANGTVALELALRTFGIGPGDEVVVTPRTFIASASCAVLQGAIPVFADVDRDSQNTTADSIRKVLSRKTKAIITVHLAGWPCDMDAIMELAGRHGVTVIEDCAQAHGAKYNGKPVGSFGHAAAYSFCQD